jgi:hypothetical protein
VTRTARLALLTGVAAVVLRRRRSHRARVGLYFSDGLLLALPPAAPAALQLRAAAGEVLRTFSPAAAVPAQES